jgi:biotin transport system substrate-specific component
MPSNTPTVADDPSILATARAARATRQSAAVTFGSVLGFFLLVTLAAQVRIPVPGTEVPMTLQLLGVSLAGLLLSPNQAAAALSTYLVFGTAGLPVFSPGSTGLWGPTGGYLVGFIPAAWLMSVLRGRDDTGVSRLFGAGAVGVVVIFVCGIGWRIAWLAGDWRLALQTGLLPFALKAMVELCLAVALVKSIHRWQGRRGGTNVSECVG